MTAGLKSMPKITQIFEQYARAFSKTICNFFNCIVNIQNSLRPGMNYGHHIYSVFKKQTPATLSNNFNIPGSISTHFGKKNSRHPTPPVAIK